MAEIYSLFMSLTGRSRDGFDAPDLDSLAFLDAGINKASQILGLLIDEEVNITQGDIDAGYVELSRDIVGIIDTSLNPLREGVHWQTDGTKKILFIQPKWFSPGTFKVLYKTTFKTFDGEMRDEDYFDFPRAIDLGIVFWALSIYMETKGITTADGESMVQSKSEEGMSIAFDNYSSYRVSSPRQLRERAIDIFRNIPNSVNNNFSVTV